MSILIIYGLFTCKFAYLLEFICNFKIKIHNTFVFIHGYIYSTEKLRVAQHAHYLVKSTKAMLCLIVLALIL